MSRLRLPLPLTGVLRPNRREGWTTKLLPVSASFTDLPARRMEIPSAATHGGVILRALELLRAQISPVTPLAGIAERNEVPLEWLVVAEEARVLATFEGLFPEDYHMLLAYAPFTPEPAPPRESNIREQWAYAQQVAALCVMWPRYDPLIAPDEDDDEAGGDARDLHPAIQERIELSQSARRRWLGALEDDPSRSTLPKAVGLAKELAEIWAPPTTTGGDQCGLGMREVPISEQPTEEELRTDPGRMARKEGHYRGAGHGRWEDFELLECPLTQDYEARRLMRKQTAREHGELIGDVSRLRIDEKVFKAIELRTRGAVLIDVSGSMQLEAQQVRQLVLACPSVTVAIYASGYASGGLRVVAKDGKIANESWAFEPPGGGNEIDGPALRWLAKQPGPRIWVSDGVVTGTGDALYKNLFDEVQQICLQHRIVRIERPIDAPHFIKELRRRRYH